MNRNQMYTLLQETGLKQLTRKNSKKGKSYHFEYVLNQERDDYDCDVLFEWGYVTGVYSIAIHRDEIVISSKYSDMALTVNYRFINDDEFEVRVYNSDGESTYRK